MCPLPPLHESSYCKLCTAESIWYSYLYTILIQVYVYYTVKVCTCDTSWVCSRWRDVERPFTRCETPYLSSICYIPREYCADVEYLVVPHINRHTIIIKTSNTIRKRVPPPQCGACLTLLRFTKCIHIFIWCAARLYMLYITARLRYPLCQIISISTRIRTHSPAGSPAERYKLNIDMNDIDTNGGEQCGRLAKTG